MTTRQQQYRDLYSGVVGIYAHKAIEAYLRDQYQHVPPHSPGPLSPQPRALETMNERVVPMAQVVFAWPVPDSPGNGGKLDFAARYRDEQGRCVWEVHEIKPAGWHYSGLGPAALTQLTSYTSGILRDEENFENCHAVPATRWREGETGWKTIPGEYAPLLAAYNVKLQVQTWYFTEPGIVYYRFVWQDRNKRRQALTRSLSSSLADLVNKIARRELPLSNRYVYGELLPWMHAMYHEDREAGGQWEDQDSLQELIDIKLSLDDPATAVDEDESSDIFGGCDWEGQCVPARQRNETDPFVTTREMVEYWGRWLTPDPWYFKDWSKAWTRPWTPIWERPWCIPGSEPQEMDRCA